VSQPAHRPLVTIFIPMRNERGFIGPCLDCVAAFDWPADRLQVLVLDGESDDGSPATVQEYASRLPSIQLVPNPARIQAAAFNRALALARGEYFVRLDAHSEYASDYVTQCVAALETRGAANAGGPQRPAGRGYVDRAIALAYQSRFAAGDAAFRYAGDERWVDTVYLGAWRTETLRRLGGMNESWLVNEDYELNYRLRQAGGKILLTPAIRSCYWVRPSLRALARQYFRYGMWRVRTLATHLGSLRWRQLASPLLVVGLVGSAVLAPIAPRAALVLPAVYLLACVTASVATASQKDAGARFLPIVPVIFATIHLAWGSGFLVGLLRFGHLAARPAPNPPATPPAKAPEASGRSP
jgi:succinoglycan biosynthesis protein ExoA